MTSGIVLKQYSVCHGAKFYVFTDSRRVSLLRVRNPLSWERSNEYIEVGYLAVLAQGM